MSGSQETGAPGAVELSGEVLARACLTVINGKGSGTVFPLRTAEVIIGRGSDAHIRVDDKPVSSHHARIYADGIHHCIVDLDSTNGTFLNGKRLKPNAPETLAFGDSIQVAETVLAYVADGSHTREQTQQLSVLSPQLPGSELLRLPDAQLIAQLLQSASVPAQETTPTESLDNLLDKLLKVWGVVKRHWATLVTATVLCAVVGNLSVFLRPPSSDATVRLRLTPKTPENPLQRVDHYEQNDDHFYESAAQGFTSPTVVSATIKAMGQKPEPWLISGALSGLKIERVGTGLYVGTFTHRDPEFAVKFLTHHVKAYLDAEVNKKIQVVQAQVDFLKSQLSDRNAELQRTEDDLKKFKDTNLEGLPEVAQGQFSSRGELYMKRAELSAQLSRTNLELDQARKRLSEEAPMLARKVAGAAPYEQSLVEVRRKLSEARGKGFGEGHPEIVALEKQASELERLADEARKSDATALERGADTGLLQLRNRVGDLEVASRGTGAELGEVNAELSRIESVVKSMPEVEAKYAQLTRSYAANKDVHSKIFSQLKTSELDLELQRTSARAQYEIVSPPGSVGIPMRKTLFVRTVAGGFAGIVLAVVIVAIREFRVFLQAYRRRRVAIVPVRS